MKTFFLFFLLAGHSAYAVWLPDSIIVNAGKRSKVIFYGQTRQDLKQLERLDLNTLLQKLNKQYDSTYVDSVGSIDDGNDRRFLKLNDPSLIKQTPPVPAQKPWQKYLTNTFINVYGGIGYNRNRYTYLPGPAVETFLGPNSKVESLELYGSISLRARSAVGVGIVHENTLLNRNRYAFKLRYGLGGEVLALQYEYYNTYIIRSESLTREEIRELYYKYDGWDYLHSFEVTPIQTDFRAVSGYLQLMPKFTLKNKQGKSTYFLAAGIRLSRNKLIQSLSPFAANRGLVINSTAGSRTTGYKGPVIITKEYTIVDDKKTTSLSFVGEAGYKSIALFWNYIPHFSKLQPSTDSSNPSPYPGQGKLGFITVGLKLGR